MLSLRNHYMSKSSKLQVRVQVEQLLESSSSPAKRDSSPDLNSSPAGLVAALLVGYSQLPEPVIPSCRMVQSDLFCCLLSATSAARHKMTYLNSYQTCCFIVSLNYFFLLRHHAIHSLSQWFRLAWCQIDGIELPWRTLMFVYDCRKLPCYSQTVSRLLW